MASTPSELTLDCKPHSLDQQIDRKLNLEDFLSCLEEERLKIDAFKPLEASRQQLQAYSRNQGSRPVLEKFMPLKNLTSDKSQNTSDHKANWMTTAQLWSQEGNQTKPESSVTDIGLNVGPNLGLDTKQRIGGAFLPFSSKNRKCSESLPDLALASLNKNMEDRKCNSEIENGVACQRRDKVGAVIEHHNGTGNNTADGQTTNTNNNQPHRKARRCWSPDLHRRFVNALQMLGGSQVATPKQIRELMKVDGLTNDEVKSHLQKYRLHTRRPSPSPQAVGAPAPQLVVLGGIWVPQEFSTAAHRGGTSLYGAHHPAHFCASPMPQEFYSAGAAVGASATPALPPTQLHHQHYHTLHHQFHNMYNAASRARSSLEPDIREAGDRSDSIEDGKSESSSWKGESGGDQRRR
ncbi:myb family transcription factor EFM-like isoform X2 [Hibiscus syriacus]|uniref:myb family transcription factor EFM-like isoform X2 n=1 Tax=Hibiscus syriacus TaxID=106335 RepID=UPI001923D8EF|nr:myb family transcription factor EFM-like isoform X2 [Hibiscus syriacus]